MTRSLIFLTLFLFTACQKTEVVDVYNGTDGKDGQDGSSCSVSPAFDETLEFIIGVRVSCTDGSSQVVLNGADGTNGTPGADGIQGEPGNSCSISRGEGDTYVTIRCENSDPVVLHDGQDGAVGSDGEDGTDGANGSDGSDGEDGTDGTDGSNGQDGVAGADGEDGSDGENGISSNGCTLTFAPNQGNNGRKYILTCGNTSIKFTADAQ